MNDTQDTTENDGMTDDTPDSEWEKFSAMVDAAWEELRQYYNHGQDDGGDDENEGDEVIVDSAASDDDALLSNPAIKHGEALFALYLARRPGDLANEAARTVFLMFINCNDALECADAAAAQIGDDLDALAAVAPTYVQIYRIRRDELEAEALGERLLEKLGSDERRSGLLCGIADSWMWNGQYDKVRPACERIIAMNASEHDVRRAKSMIYEMDNLNVGQMAPAFEATDIDGNAISLAGLRGKVVLIDFWATWCGPCRGEFPHLRRVNEKFTGDRFTLLSISLDEDCDEARKMIEKDKLAWTHVCEGKWSGSRIAELYNVMGIPSTWLIGADGRIAQKDLRGHDTDKAVAALLGLAETPAA